LEMSSNDWFDMTKPRFNELFRKSAVKRTGCHGLLRNLKFLRDGNS
jgi:epoxyqueuosine reductase